jgi:hypothetical protein
MDNWPHELLADERVPKQTIQDAARQAGVAWRTVERPKTHTRAARRRPRGPGDRVPTGVLTKRDCTAIR